MVVANKFTENSDLSTMYLGWTEMTRDTNVKAKERFPITHQGFVSGKLLDGTECQILIDTGATKSYMLLLFEKQGCTFTTKVLFQYSGNLSGKWTICECIFIIPVVINVHEHRFKIFMLVSKIHDNVGLVMGMKTFFN